LFRGKVALVTGGGTGLGYAIALELALTGCQRVVIASRNADMCRQAANEINRIVQDARNSEVGKSEGVVIAGPSTNIRKADEVAALVSFCLRTAGSLDLLVNNAGGQFLSPAEKISDRGYASVVETNLVGTFLVCQQAYLQYMKEHGGSIVNITLGNRNGFPLMAHSGASRAGVENMSATLCTEWIGSGVRINCVRPGIIFTESGFAHYGPAGEQFAKGLLPVMPSKRFGSPQELSSAVVWLLSEGPAT
jgi:peroxisomal trans-2-enoyl-CoA reductase